MTQLHGGQKIYLLSLVNNKYYLFQIIFVTYSQSRLADILVQNWDLGRPDISIVSPLHPSTLAKAGEMVGAVLKVTRAGNTRPHDEKCGYQLLWQLTPIRLGAERLQYFWHKYSKA